jgi:hypothetical protein
MPNTSQMPSEGIADGFVEVLMIRLPGATKGQLAKRRKMCQRREFTHAKLKPPRGTKADSGD